MGSRTTSVSAASRRERLASHAAPTHRSLMAKHEPVEVKGDKRYVRRGDSARLAAPRSAATGSPSIRPPDGAGASR